MRLLEYLRYRSPLGTTHGSRLAGKMPFSANRVKRCITGSIEVNLLTSLVVPSLAPSTRTQGAICVIKLGHHPVNQGPSRSVPKHANLATRLEILALGIYTLVIVDVVLPAMLCPGKKSSCQPRKLQAFGIIRLHRHTDFDWGNERRSQL